MNEIDIKGIWKTSLIDYPGKVAATIFLSRCNFRCPYCHNPELVFDSKELPSIDPQETLNFLKSRKKWLDGVCLTGGEPTLHPGLKDFVAAIKELGLLVKLDTNGTRPGVIKDLKNLLDYVAIDIKAPKEKYATTIKADAQLEAIEESINILKSNHLEHEFRTTVVPRFLQPEDMKAIGQWLKGSKKFVLQQFKNDSAMLDNDLQNDQPYRPTELEAMQNSVKPYFETVEVRGI